MNKNKSKTNHKREGKKPLILIIFFLCSTFAHSQNTVDTTNSNVRGIIKVNPLQALVGEVRIAYEQPIIHNISLEFGAGYIYKIFEGQEFNDNWVQWGNLVSDYTGYSLRCGIKIYLFRNNDYSGIFCNPLIFYKYNYHKEIYNNYLYEDKIYAKGIQLLLGYTLPSFDKFLFEIYGGIGDRWIIDNYSTQDTTNTFYPGKFYYHFYTIQFGFTVGYKFGKK